MTRNRYDETWHRLREWTNGQAGSERLAAQVLIHDGFRVDPSHPLGGRDGGRDALAYRDAACFVMAAYFPRGQQDFTTIRRKFESDLAAATRNDAHGVVFVTNQELRLAEREELATLATIPGVELYHLERVTTILDSPAMAEVRKQFLDIETDDPPTVSMGGHGGAAPGAGGGGGGAIGPDAKGGSGGPGGEINLHGTPGTAPGAGGGGAGAVGGGAVGGEGGTGGEYASVLLGPDEIGPESEFHHLDIQVGKGGVEGPGEDTIVNLRDEHGNVLRSIVAKGGRAGAPAHVPPPSRQPTKKDIEDGLKITGVIAADVIHLKHGLWTVVGGGWDWIQCHTNPFRITLPLLVEAETGKIDPGAILDLSLIVRSPDGFQVCGKDQIVTVDDSPVQRTRFCAVLEFSGSQAGLWRVQILGGRLVIGDFPIEIRAPERQESDGPAS